MAYDLKYFMNVYIFITRLKSALTVLKVYV